jgi:hypothetical protein
MPDREPDDPCGRPGELDQPDHEPWRPVDRLGEPARLAAVIVTPSVLVTLGLDVRVDRALSDLMGGAPSRPITGSRCVS